MVIGMVTIFVVASFVFVLLGHWAAPGLVGFVLGALTTVAYAHVRYKKLQTALRESSDVPYTIEEILSDVERAVRYELARLETERQLVEDGHRVADSSEDN